MMRHESILHQAINAYSTHYILSAPGRQPRVERVRVILRPELTVVWNMLV
jgi:hypothetical protein